MATAAVKKETKELHPAEIKKLEAETASYLAETRLRNAEAESEEHRAYIASVSAIDTERSEKQYLAGDSANHRYNFVTGVTATSVYNCMTRLTQWHRETPGCDIEIVFNSPGGSVIDGMALFDHIRILSRAGHKITTGTLGWAASMGGILLQAGDHRWIGKESYLMIHEISAGTGGKVGEIKDDMGFYEMICDRVVDLFVNRSGKKISKAQFKKNWERKDWFISSDDALRLGFVDEVR